MIFRYMFQMFLLKKLFAFMVILTSLLMTDFGEGFAGKLGVARCNAGVELVTSDGAGGSGNSYAGGPEKLRWQQQLCPVCWRWCWR